MKNEVSEKIDINVVIGCERENFKVNNNKLIKNEERIIIKINILDKKTGMLYPIERILSISIVLLLGFKIVIDLSVTYQKVV